MGSKAQIVIPWKKQPRQLLFLKACGLDHPFNSYRKGKPGKPAARVILYGGAAGGGKTDALLIAGFIAAMSFPGCSIGYFRREYPHLEGPGGAIPRSHALFSGRGRYHGGQRRWTFPGGSVLQFCHCKNEDDVYGYQSQQFDFLLVDEASQFTRFQLRYLTSRNRATVKGVVPLAAWASNPGNVGHGMLKREFIDAGPWEQPVKVQVEPGRYETHIFIPAKLSDNQVLEKRDPGYRETLENLPEEVRKALLHGDWSVFAGQYFKTFDREKHVTEPFKIPYEWMKFASIDWGFAAPCAVLWHAVDPAMNRVITYRELYVTEHTPKQVAEKIIDLSGRERLRYIKLSPDAWQERGLSSKALGGESIAEDFQQMNLPVEAADNRRVMGWSRIRQFLSDAPDGFPWWQVFSNCHNLIRTLPDLIHDSRNVEDVSDACEDHAPEALRYGLMSRPQPTGSPDGMMAGSGSGYGAGRGSFDEDVTEDLEDIMEERFRGIPGFYG